MEHPVVRNYFATFWVGNLGWKLVFNYSFQLVRLCGLRPVRRLQHHRSTLMNSGVWSLR